MADTSRTATGIAKASEAALHRSTSGCRLGRLPWVRSRRSSDSAAHRYWVGRSPIWVKARRHAWISPNSPSGPWASRDRAAAVNRAAGVPASAAGEMPSASITPGTRPGKSRQISS